MLPRRNVWAVGLVAALLVWGPAAATACGASSDCKIGARTYRIRMPAGHDGKAKVGAIVFAHGYRASGRAAVESKGFAALAASFKLAIIAVKSKYAGWALANGPGGAEPRVDEVAYFDRVIEDVARRFPIDHKRLVAAGFSSGAMMTWTLACERGERFAGFIPIAGTFWRPVPEACPTRAGSLIHIHGDRDKVVPLNGRPIRQAHQAMVAKAIEMYVRHGQFGTPRYANFGDMRCAQRRNAAGNILNDCRFAGGHTFSLAQFRTALQMLRRAGRI